MRMNLSNSSRDHLKPPHFQSLLSQSMSDLRMSPNLKGHNSSTPIRKLSSVLVTSSDNNNGSDLEQVLIWFHEFFGLDFFKFSGPALCKTILIILFFTERNVFHTWTWHHHEWRSQRASRIWFSHFSRILWLVSGYPSPPLKWRPLLAFRQLGIRKRIFRIRNLAHDKRSCSTW